jgi:FMN phosphatase YigB (HAD superfamily)
MEGQTRKLLGDERAEEFWNLYEEVRHECDFVDFPRTLERYSERFPDEPNFARLASELLCYPYREYLFPGALDAVHYVKTMGTIAIVSDGDRVFQPSKIARAGLAQAFENRVLIFTHKDEEFDEVERRVPAERYVLVDDKPSILATLKRRLADRLVAVHVRQGKYARERDESFAADIELDGIGELAKVPREAFLTAGSASR